MRPELRSSRGTSLLMVNSDAGEKMMDKIRYHMALSEITEQQSLQPCLQRPTTSDPRRAQFWNDYSEHGSVMCTANTSMTQHIRNSRI